MLTCPPNLLTFQLKRIKLILCLYLISGIVSCLAHSSNIQLRYHIKKDEQKNLHLKEQWNNDADNKSQKEAFKFCEWKHSLKDLSPEPS